MFAGALTAPAAPAEARSGAARASRPLRICFVMEQVLGHVTCYQNLRAAVATLEGIEPQWVETKLFEPNGRLERAPLPSSVRAGARALLEVRRALRGRRCDVLVFNTQKPAIFCQLELLRTPTMLMTDVTPVQYDAMASFYDHRLDRNPMVRGLKHFVNVVNFRLARAVVPWSEWVRGSLLRDYGVPAERMHVVAVGVDTGFWRPPERRRGTGLPWLLFVGGQFRRKGGGLLLDVFRRLRLHERAELHVVTRDPLAPEPGVIVHRDVQNNSVELLRLYQSADVFVLPTFADCFSNASIEAMACGLPVLTTPVGGIPDIVEQEATGYLLPVGDGRALGAAVVRLLEDPALARALGAGGRERAVRLFHSRRNAARIVDLARTIAAGSAWPQQDLHRPSTPQP